MCVRDYVLIQRPDEALQRLADASLHVGQTQVWRLIWCTEKHHFGPLMAIGTWQPGEDDPLYVITNTHNSQAALRVKGELLKAKS